MTEPPGDIVNRLVLNVQPPGEHRGVLFLPLPEPAFAHVQHVTFRELSREDSRTKREIVHDVYHILYVSAGHATFLVAGRPYHAIPGRLFLTSPGEPHCFSNVSGEDAELCEVTFQFFRRDGAALAWPLHEIVSGWVGRPCRPVTETEAPPALRRLLVAEIERMARAGLEQEPDFNLVLNESLARLFLGLYTHVYREAPPESPDDPLRKVHDHILRRYAEPLSLPELAGLAGLSVNYMAQRFKARNGATPIYFQHRLRTLMAANLLETTHYPVKQIAGLVGYRDVYFFTRVFTKLQGIPPARYRKQKWGTVPGEGKGKRR